MAGAGGADTRADGDPVSERCQKHYARVGRFLDELRLKHACAGADITVQLSNGSLLRMHSSVAAAHSAYFRQLILDKGRLLHVDLSRSPRSDAVRHVVDYMYTGTIVADLSYISDLLHVASVWQIGSLSEQLEKKLVEHSLEPSTTLKAFDIAVLNQASISPSTRATIYSNAMKNLQKSSRTQSDFTRLSPKDAIALLTSDELTVHSELDVARILLVYLRLIKNRLNAHDARKMKADPEGTLSQKPSLCTDAHVPVPATSVDACNRPATSATNLDSLVVPRSAASMISTQETRANAMPDETREPQRPPNSRTITPRKNEI